MELTPIYKRVIGLDVHQAKISACAVAEQADGKVTVESREFGGFKRDRRTLAEWAKSFDPSRGGGHGEHRQLLEESLCGTGERGHRRLGRQRPTRQDRARAQDRFGRFGRCGRCGRCSRCAVARHLGACRVAAGLVHPAGRHPLPAPDCPPAAKARWHAGFREEPAAQAARRRRYPAQCGGVRYSRSGCSCHGQSADLPKNHPGDTGLGETFAR